MKNIILITMSLGASVLVPGNALAQTYPTKTIRIVVPFPPGGAADILARQLAPKLSEKLGQQLIIDNRVGAGGNIGTEIAARAAPDGYTFLLAPGSTMTVNPALYSKLAFDPVKDFVPVTQMVVVPYIVVVHPSVSVNSIKGLIALAKTRPNQIAYASSGSGQATHLAGELFTSKAGISMVHVPYKGAGPAIVDLVGGQVSVMFGNMGSVLPFVKNNKLRVLAVTAAKRHPLVPDVPTVAESGLAGYEISEWYGFFAPSGTPKEVVARLHVELVDVLGAATMANYLLSQGFTPIASASDAFSQVIRADLTKWAALVKRANIHAD